MEVSNQNEKYILNFETNGGGVISEARVVLDAIGAYWDSETKDKPPMAQKFIVRELFQMGIGNMHDEMAATVDTDDCELHADRSQVRWLLRALDYHVAQNRYSSDIIAAVSSQTSDSIARKIEECLI